MNTQNNQENKNESTQDKFDSLKNKIHKIFDLMKKKNIFDYELEEKNYLDEEYIVNLGDMIKFANSVRFNIKELRAQNQLLRVMNNKNYVIACLVGSIIEFFDENSEEDYIRCIDICSFLANLKYFKYCVPAGDFKNEK